MSLDEIIKSIISEINNQSPGNDGLTAEFYKHFSNTLAPALSDVYDSWRKRLASWVLLLKQGSYLLHIKKVIKKILQTIDLFHF